MRCVYTLDFLVDFGDAVHDFPKVMGPLGFPSLCRNIQNNKARPGKSLFLQSRTIPTTLLYAHLRKEKKNHLLSTMRFVYDSRGDSRGRESSFLFSATDKWRRAERPREGRKEARRPSLCLRAYSYRVLKARERKRKKEIPGCSSESRQEILQP